MSGWGKPDLAVLKRRERTEVAPLLEFALPGLCVERALYAEPTAPGEPLGA